MAGMYHQAVKQLEEWLNEKNKVTELLDKVEKTTGVKKVYIVQGFIGFLSVYMILGHFAEFICNSVGFVYPAYASIAALESVNKDDDTKWLTYWVVFAFFSVMEFFSDTLFSWFPFYWLAKVIFLLWCFLPIQNNGSMFVYNRFIRPFFLKNRREIDNIVHDVATNVAGAVTKGIDGAQKIASAKTD